MGAARFLLIIILFISGYSTHKIALLHNPSPQEEPVTQGLYRLLSDRYGVSLFETPHVQALTALDHKDFDYLIVCDTFSRELIRKAQDRLNTSLIYVNINPDSSTQASVIHCHAAAGSAFGDIGHLLERSHTAPILFHDSANADRARLEQKFYTHPPQMKETETAHVLRQELKKAFSEHRTHFRFLFTKENTEEFSDTPQLFNTINRGVTALAPSFPKIWKEKISDIPLISIRPDSVFEEHAAAFFIALTVEEKLPDNLHGIYIDNSIAALSYQAITHYTLGGMPGNISRRLKQYLENPQAELPAWEKTQDLFGERLNFDTASSTPAYSGIPEITEEPTPSSSPAMPEQIRTALFSIITHPWYNIIVSILLAGTVLIIIILLITRTLHQRNRIAVLFPPTLKKAKISDDRNSRYLKKVLKKEGFTTLFPGSLLSMQKLIQKRMPDVFLVDWRHKRAVAYMQKELKTYSLSSAETIVVFNIPERRKKEQENAFGMATTLLYSGLPAREELIQDMQTRNQSNEELSGKIKEEGLTSILPILETNKNTGCLVIEDDSPLSILYYDQGRIIHSEDRLGNTDLEAVFTGLSCRKGTFRFLSDKTALTQTMDLGAMEILLEHSRRTDESPQH
ncbi:MAG: DUF4388 domain-containing protein [Fibrobacterota bacterium]